MLIYCDKYTHPYKLDPSNCLAGYRDHLSEQVTDNISHMANFYCDKPRDPVSVAHRNNINSALYAIESRVWPSLRWAVKEDLC